MLGTRRTGYVAVLLAGRVADSATTLYGLSIPGIYECNPTVAWLVAALGPGAGLLVANVVAVGLVVLVGEVGVRYCRRSDREAASVPLALAVCYLPFAVVSFGAAVHNLRVIAAA